MCILGISDVNIFQPRLSIFLGIPLHRCWMEVDLCKTFLRADVSKHVVAYSDNDSKSCLGILK